MVGQKSKRRSTRALSASSAPVAQDSEPFPSDLTPQSKSRPKAQLTDDDLLLLTHASFISQYMPISLDKELQSYAPGATRFTNPYALVDGDDAPFASEAKSSEYARVTEDLWHIPLMSIGNAEGNGMLVRLSIPHTQPSVLYISFRPLDLSNISEIVRRTGYVNTALKYARSATVRADHTTTSLNNTITLVNMLSERALMPNGMSRGYHDFTTVEQYPIVIENEGVDVMGRQLAFRGPPLQLRSTRKSPEAPPQGTMADTIAGFIAENAGCFDHVVFTGFSLGSGTSLACAYGVHTLLERALAGRTSPMPSITCVQFAGTTVGNAVFRDECKRLSRLTTYYIALQNPALPGVDAYDPVTYMPHNDCRRVHVADTYLIADFNDQSRERIRIGTYDCDVLRNKVWGTSALVLSYLSGRDGGLAGITGFKKIHLAGEDMICRLLLLELFKRRTKSKLRAVPCRFFSTSNTAAKWKVCPEEACSLEATRYNNLVRNKCVSQNTTYTPEAKRQKQDGASKGGAPKGKSATPPPPRSSQRTKAARRTKATG